jgi:protein TonB
MNLNLRIDEISAQRVTGFPPPRAAGLAGFGPALAPARPKRNRAAGIAGVIAMHALLVAGYLFAAPAFTKPQGPTSVTLVELPPEIEKRVDPKPLIPDFAPPPVFVPAAIIPEVQLATPTPPPVITVPVAPPSPPTAPMAAPAPPAPPAITGESQAAFAGRLFKHLNSYKRYPERAKLRHQEGVVSIRFTMDKTGHVLSFAIAKSSGSELLDAEARDLVKRAEPLPPIPPEFGRETLDLVVPIEFFLR